MAKLFQERTDVPSAWPIMKKTICPKCGCIYCLNCLDSLEKEPDGETFWCLVCSMFYKKEKKKDIKPNQELRKLVSTTKELEPQLQTALLVNPRMWKFTMDMTLDVDRANNLLVFSDDHRSVGCGKIKQHQPLQHERLALALCVLGSSRFTSNRHYWYVVVGTSTEWDLGKCRESVHQGGWIQLTTDLGFWTINLRADGCFSASTMPQTPLTVDPKLCHVSIVLVTGLGNISFFHVENESHPFTFMGVLAEGSLAHFFAPSIPPNGNQGVLSICPLMNLGVSSFLALMGKQDKPPQQRNMDRR
ncbi:LOW QUALITY PROTEIN: ret finger protein-like 3 [Marmota monax]|uniref:LOW QUALITY PROTEIN: ret finger protein-like 3 n=1 Tax=Marmota monax TaxID=9995 RepID=UPI001EAFE002|nr:LOW QUALITY PROTEIN: ret finger protein-like 3 [Marmota monax]